MSNFSYERIRQARKDHELITLLDEYFQHRRQFQFDGQGNITSFVYSKSEGNYHVELVLDKQGRIVKIVPREHLSDQEASQLEVLIKDTLLDDTVMKVGRTICFLSGVQLERYFRCKDFQILPVPDHAPKSLQNCPFLLEFSYPASSHWIVNGIRRQATEQKYLILLGLFLTTQIQQNPPLSPYRWTMDRESKVEERCYGYTYAAYDTVSDAFSDTTPYQAADLIPHQLYYGTMLAALTVWSAANLELQIPASLCASFEKVGRLSDIDYEKFMRACYYFHQAQQLWSSSLSFSLIALVTAIECLAGKNKEKCKTCGQDIVASSERCIICDQPQFQVTNHFKKFVETQYPAMTQFPEAMGLLYKTRSNLVHGSEILLKDSQPWLSFMNNTKALQQYDVHGQAYLITKIVLLNWLHSRSV